VLGLYGEADQDILPADAEKMRAALTAAGKPGEIVIYDGAPHGSRADYRPSHREAAVKDGWQRPQATFKQPGIA
jgi:carboxymethylenebutenolidase